MNSRQARREPRVSHDAHRWRGRTTAMLAVVIRFFLDAVYVCLFFAGMSGFAYLSHLLVRSAEHAEMDGLVILVLRCVEVVLAAIDGLGIVIASAFLTYRFIVALFRADGDA